MLWRTPFLLFLSLASLACGGPSDQLEQATAAYRHAHYEDTLVWLESIEPHISKMPAASRTRYYYLHGMSAFRMGDADEALYYLALADAMTSDGNNELEPTWQQNLNRALADLVKRQPLAPTAASDQPLDTTDSQEQGYEDDRHYDDGYEDDYGDSDNADPGYGY